MLTPKHRALFAAAYSALLLRGDGDAGPASAGPSRGQPGDSGNDEPDAPDLPKSAEPGGG